MQSNERQTVPLKRGETLGVLRESSFLGGICFDGCVCVGGGGGHIDGAPICHRLEETLRIGGEVDRRC